MKISTVIIVDDNDGQRYMLQTYLLQQGYRVITFEDGKQCFDSIFSICEEINLMIIDCVMPNMDGPTLMSLLKSDQRTKNIPIVMTSADDIKTYGCIFLRKPFSTEQLESSINYISKSIMY